MEDFFESRIQDPDNPCDICIWMDLVKEYEPPCCYCINYGNEDPPKDFDVKKLKDKILREKKK